ncbi:MULTISPECIES: adaptor protein MecA [Cytobacillus]|uniref:adaptor protein MecA n=1 Tax=Cytobacillus TaxID=2675230 RepID=UPI00203EA512|nr:adaptor protein MecA [Cytobacillus kochii]MCM3320747.1 adaptor protein MecA [Cytobacillus kochii]MCM3344419.1 adaptor protein MecA [Cytobacillus kochii]MDM5208263.1 adaptor protein MecA [Cytobacillus kochii]
MQLERLNDNKIKILLTLDDLFERGLSKEDIWKDSLKWHQLFQDMLEEASEEFDLDIYGTISIEIFSMQIQGMVMIVTIQEEVEEEWLKDGIIDFQVDVDKQDYILYEFDDFENIISLSHRKIWKEEVVNSLYVYNGLYYVLIECNRKQTEEKLISILAEYGTVSFVSLYIIKEYGKELIRDHALEKIEHYFK